MNIWSAVLDEAADAQLWFVLGWIAAMTLGLRLSGARAGKAGPRLMFAAAYLVLIPVAGIVRAQGLGASAELHTAVLFCGVEACVLAAGALIFQGILPRLRARIPRILQDLALALAATVTGLAVASHAGMNVSGLITTSAVLTAVVGLSLQDTLGNVMSGLFLQLDNSFDVGDKVKIGDTVGRVVDIQWRFTAVETAAGDTVVIPNGDLMKTQVVVLGRRAAGGPRRQRRSIEFNVDFRRPPTQVIDAVTGALVGRRIPNVAEDPAPTVVLSEFGESYARYTARYWLTDIFNDAVTDSNVRSIIFFALRRAKLSLAIPATADFVIEHSESKRAEEERLESEERRAALSRVDIFKCLSDEERGNLCESLHSAPFARGEIITRQGTEAHWLYLVAHGSVSVRLSGDQGLEKEVARLGPGDFFGEMSLLTGKPRSTTVVALDEVRCWRLGKPAFEAVIARRPDVADSIADILTKRRTELVAMREGLDEEAAAKRLAADRRDLVASIKRFFDISGAPHAS